MAKKLPPEFVCADCQKAQPFLLSCAHTLHPLRVEQDARCLPPLRVSPYLVLRSAGLPPLAGKSWTLDWLLRFTAKDDERDRARAQSLRRAHPELIYRGEREESEAPAVARRLADARAYWITAQRHAEADFPSCPLTEEAFRHYAEAAAMQYPSSVGEVPYDDRVEAVNTAILDLLGRGYNRGITGGYAGFVKWLRGKPWSIWTSSVSTPWFRVNPPGEEQAFPRGKTPWLIHFEAEEIEVGHDDEPASTATIEDFAGPEESVRGDLHEMIVKLCRGRAYLEALVPVEWDEIRFTPQVAPKGSQARRKRLKEQREAEGRLLRHGYGLAGAQVKELAARADHEQDVILALRELESHIAEAWPDRESPLEQKWLNHPLIQRHSVQPVALRIGSKGSLIQVAAVQSLAGFLRESFARYRYGGERGLAVVTVERLAQPPRRWYVNEPYVPPTPTMPVLPTDDELDLVSARVAWVRPEDQNESYRLRIAEICTSLAWRA